MVMKRKHIILLQDNEEFGYHLMESDEGVPFYVPDDEIEFEEGVNTDTVIFLPIEEKTFLKDRKNRFVAFRLRFDSAEHSTMVFGVDPNNLSWTDIQITGSMNRIIYSIDRSLRLVVHEERDPMFPPEVNHVYGPSDSIGAVVLEAMEEQVNLYGKWVLSHNI